MRRMLIAFAPFVILGCLACQQTTRSADQVRELRKEIESLKAQIAKLNEPRDLSKPAPVPGVWQVFAAGGGVYLVDTSNGQTYERVVDSGSHMPIWRPVELPMTEGHKELKALLKELTTTDVPGKNEAKKR